MKAESDRQGQSVANRSVKRGRRLFFMVVIVVAIAAAFWIIKPDGLRDLLPQTAASKYEQGKAELARQFPGWIGPAQPLDYFAGSWRRERDVYLGSVVRIVIREDGAGPRVRLWYACEAEGGNCEVPETAAALQRDAGGRIAHLSAEANVPGGKIWMVMGSGKVASQPAIIASQFYSNDQPTYQDPRILSNVVFREMSKEQLATWVGEWRREGHAADGELLRLSIRAASPIALTVSAWARCKKESECDLGEATTQTSRTAKGRADRFSAYFDERPMVDLRSKRVNLHLDLPVEGVMAASANLTIYDWQPMPGAYGRPGGHRIASQSSTDPYAFRMLRAEPVAPATSNR